MAEVATPITVVPEERYVRCEQPPARAQLRRCRGRTWLRVGFVFVFVFVFVFMSVSVFGL